MVENYETIATQNLMNHDINAWIRIMKPWKLRINNNKKVLDENYETMET